MTDLRAQLQSTFGEAYTIERELGGGGMSRVFVATEHSLGRPVVVKVLPGETAGALSLERFRREIRLAASLQQANIVPVLSAGDAGGVAYYTMPFVKGESLRSHLDAQGPLPVGQCVAILRDVARALAFAHDEGVVHRDIKPDNILLSGGTAVVTDFGIAKAVAESSRTTDNATLTQMGTALGTPAYMAPEQVVGERVDHRADIYALGVVAYEMLSGASPFGNRSAQAMLAAHVMEAPVPLTEKRPGLSAGLAGLVMQCLAKEQAERPESAAAVLAALDSMTASQEVLTPARTPDEMPSIAVMPFENLSPESENEYFADGLTDEIITDLSTVRGLRVIARASMMRFKRTGKEPRVVAREVSARYTLDGTVRRAGPSLRLTVRLTDARDDNVVWSDKINGSVEDVFAIQERVSRTIVDALRITLTPPDATSPTEVARPHGANAQAIEEYLRGRHFFALATADGLAKSRDAFQRATAIDPSFAAAFAGYAHTSAFMTVGWQSLPPRETMPKAHAAARRAVELDPRLAEAHAALGVVAAFYDWDLSAAERAFRESLRLNANYPDAYYSYAQSLMWLDVRFGEAIEYARRAVNISPLDPWAHWYLGLAHYFDRNYEARIDIHRRLISLHPHWGFGYFGLGMTLSTVGRPVEATTHHLRAIELDGRSPNHLAGLGASYTLSGNDAGALECLAELEEHERQGKSVWAWKLITYAALGRADDVIRALERACDERASTLIIQLNHPFLDFVREDPRFHALLRRMGLERLVSYRPTREFRRGVLAAE